VYNQRLCIGLPSKLVYTVPLPKGLENDSINSGFALPQHRILPLNVSPPQPGADNHIADRTAASPTLLAEQDTDKLLEETILLFQQIR
jgi:hypothetical protein